VIDEIQPESIQELKIHHEDTKTRRKKFSSLAVPLGITCGDTRDTQILRGLSVFVVKAVILVFERNSV
jgi:hypothetical protein